MEITNLEESPSGLSRSGIIAPIDILSKYNLLYNQTVLMSNDLRKNKTVIEEEFYIYIILQENATIPLHEASVPSDASLGEVSA